MPQFLLFTYLLIFSTQALGKSYSMADLEVLATEGSHEEFFVHALDIRPSERQETWKSMVSKMADSYSLKLLNKSQIEKQDFQQVEKLFSWPNLKTDDVFKARRRDLAVKYFKKCLRNSPPCWDEVVHFWENDKTDSEIGIKLAELTHEFSPSPLPTWNFLEAALKTPMSEFYCQKDFVITALWKKLGVDYIRLGPKGDFLHKIDLTVHADCLPSLNKEAEARFSSPTDPFDRELAYQVLSAQGKMSTDRRDFFYTAYLLEKPSQGELFNYAWNGLKELGASMTRREKVMKLVRKIDPLPDDILTSMDKTKQRVILSHFKQHFPEYLDYYTGQCLSFYEGKATFPKGNPTIHCQELMKSDFAPQFIDEFKLKRFETIKKI